MTKSVMQAMIDRLYAILSKRATENVLLHRSLDEHRRFVRSVRDFAIAKPHGTYYRCGICEKAWWDEHEDHLRWCPMNRVPSATL